MNKIKLECRSVTFYSEEDELCFFKWIESTKCIERFEGIDISIFITLKRDKISPRNLDDLLALFYRYKVNLSQLLPFVKQYDRCWIIRKRRRYWYRRMLWDIVSHVFNNRN